MDKRLLQLLNDNRSVKRPVEPFAVRALADGEAEIFLYDMIVDTNLEAEWFGGISAQGFVQNLRGIDAKRIHLRISSPGGSVFAASAMMQGLRDHPAQIIAHIDGVAASAASVIPMAADEIIIAPNAMVMIHQAWMFAAGNSEDMLAAAALLEKADANIVQTYAQRTGNSAQQLADWMAAETWFTAEEAVAAKFADKIAAPDANNNAQARARWNLSAYAHAPAAAPEPEPEPVETYASDEHRLRQQQRMRLAACAHPIE